MSGRLILIWFLWQMLTFLPWYLVSLIPAMVPNTSGLSDICSLSFRTPAPPPGNLQEPQSHPDSRSGSSFHFYILYIFFPNGLNPAQISIFQILIFQFWGFWLRVHFSFGVCCWQLTFFIDRNENDGVDKIFQTTPVGSQRNENPMKTFAETISLPVLCDVSIDRRASCCFQATLRFNEC